MQSTGDQSAARRSRERTKNAWKQKHNRCIPATKSNITPPGVTLDLIYTHIDVDRGSR